MILKCTELNKIKRDELFYSNLLSNQRISGMYYIVWTG